MRSKRNFVRNLSISRSPRAYHLIIVNYNVAAMFTDWRNRQAQTIIHFSMVGESNID